MGPTGLGPCVLSLTGWVALNKLPRILACFLINTEEPVFVPAFVLGLAGCGLPPSPGPPASPDGLPGRGLAEGRDDICELPEAQSPPLRTHLPQGQMPSWVRGWVSFLEKYGHARAWQGTGLHPEACGGSQPQAPGPTCASWADFASGPPAFGGCSCRSVGGATLMPIYSAPARAAQAGPARGPRWARVSRP